MSLVNLVAVGLRKPPMSPESLAVRLRSIARSLDTAERFGAESDDGERWIQLTESIVVETIIPALDEATLHVLGLADVEEPANLRGKIAIVGKDVRPGQFGASEIAQIWKRNHDAKRT